MSETTMTAVRERPILFSGPMVRAILDGRKTQTRRVVALPPRVLHREVRLTRMQPGYADGARPVWEHAGEPNAFSSRCPFCQPGDRLWVRERHAYVGDGLIWPDRAGVVYHADNAVEWLEKSAPQLIGQTVYNYEKPDGWRWRPSIHMPRWASRLTLEVTGMRVERVRDICSTDARAEGLELGGPTSFRELWDALNGPRGYGWDANPWVWVVAFRRVEAA